MGSKMENVNNIVAVMVQAITSTKGVRSGGRDSAKEGACVCVCVGGGSLGIAGSWGLAEGLGHDLPGLISRLEISRTVKWICTCAYFWNGEAAMAEGLRPPQRARFPHPLQREKAPGSGPSRWRQTLWAGGHGVSRFAACCAALYACNARQPPCASSWHGWHQHEAWM